MGDVSATTIIAAVSGGQPLLKQGQGLYILVQIRHGVIKRYLVGLEERMNIHPALQPQHPAYLVLVKAILPVTLDGKRLDRSLR